MFSSTNDLRLISHYFWKAAIWVLLQILAASSTGKGYSAAQWTAQPAFEPLQKMATWVFPKL